MSQIVLKTAGQSVPRLPVFQSFIDDVPAFGRPSQIWASA